ncbi:MAG: hypothetical protein H0X66_15650 [Verrucomicrobia bacterium]|nr:hypothetical protein [Verrucomicrobiota bacterium]
MLRSKNPLILAFCSVVLALALFQFSENTADPDLWGHIIFGQHHLKTGVLAQTEPYSWTAEGHPWINHEVLSEAALGAVHFWGGGSGVLLLKIFVGLLAFWIALRVGAQGLQWPLRAVAWAFGAIAVVEISFGFAARPQIFTALAMVVQLWLLRRVHAGKTSWSWLLPVFFVLWINTHGGALAGIVLLWLTTVATTLHFLVCEKEKLSPWLDQSVTVKIVRSLWIASFLSTGALFLNPWGPGLVEWLIGSVLWLRPEIAEWNPTTLTWEHGTFFIVAFLTVFSFLFSKQKRSLWEMAFCGALMVLAFRSVRHTPLFCLAALALAPRHLADIVTRFSSSLPGGISKEAGVQKAGAVMLFLLAGAILVATVRLHKENPFTIEVPRKQYPVAAVQFIQKHALKGNLLVFFDWGEMALWELPECPPSIDGRLDTCYPRPLISEHWKFFNGQPVDPNILNLEKADLALLPSALAGAFTLKGMPGWEAVYVDDLAVVLVRGKDRFPTLAESKGPWMADDAAITGRVPFPEQNPRWPVK